MCKPHVATVAVDVPDVGTAEAVTGAMLSETRASVTTSKSIISIGLVVVDPSGQVFVLASPDEAGKLTFAMHLSETQMRPETQMRRVSAG
jgi:hypothetical protein